MASIGPQRSPAYVHTGRPVLGHRLTDCEIADLETAPGTMHTKQAARYGFPSYAELRAEQQELVPKWSIYHMRTCRDFQCSCKDQLNNPTTGPPFIVETIDPKLSVLVVPLPPPPPTSSYLPIRTLTNLGTQSWGDTLPLRLRRDGNGVWIPEEPLRQHFPQETQQSLSQDSQQAPSAPQQEPSIPQKRGPGRPPGPNYKPPKPKQQTCPGGKEHSPTSSPAKSKQRKRKLKEQGRLSAKPASRPENNVEIIVLDD